MSLIDQYLINKQRTPKPRFPGVLYVTDIVKPCQLQAYHNILTPTSYEVETLRIFEAGNMIEDYWVGLLDKRLDVTVLGTQVPTYYYGDGFEVHGRLDILCQHDKQQLVAHEVKSAKSSHWYKSARDGHIEQVQFYMNVLGVKWGRIDYLDKGAFLEGENPIDSFFDIQANPAVFSWLVARAGRLDAALKSGDPPTANPDAWSGRICDYCTFHDVCPAKVKSEAGDDPPKVL